VSAVADDMALVWRGGKVAEVSVIMERLCGFRGGELLGTTRSMYGRGWLAYVVVSSF